MLLAVWKDLSRDPLIIQGQLANHVLEQSVATAVNEYDGEVFGLETSELPAEGRVLLRTERDRPSFPAGHRYILSVWIR